MSTSTSLFGRIAHAVPTGPKIAVPIVVASVLTHRTIKSLAVDAVKRAVNRSAS